MYLFAESFDDYRIGVDALTAGVVEVLAASFVVRGADGDAGGVSHGGAWDVWLMWGLGSWRA